MNDYIFEWLYVKGEQYQYLVVIQRVNVCCEWSGGFVVADPILCQWVHDWGAVCGQHAKQSCAPHTTEGSVCVHQDSEGVLGVGRTSSADTLWSSRRAGYGIDGISNEYYICFDKMLLGKNCNNSTAAGCTWTNTTFLSFKTFTVAHYFRRKMMTFQLPLDITLRKSQNFSILKLILLLWERF